MVTRMAEGDESSPATSGATSQEDVNNNAAASTGDVACAASGVSSATAITNSTSNVTSDATSASDAAMHSVSRKTASPPSGASLDDVTPLEDAMTASSSSESSDSSSDEGEGFRFDDEADGCSTSRVQGETVKETHTNPAAPSNPLMEELLARRPRRDAQPSPVRLRHDPSTPDLRSSASRPVTIAGSLRPSATSASLHSPASPSFLRPKHSPANRKSYIGGADAAHILSQSPIFRAKVEPAEGGATKPTATEVVRTPSLTRRLEALQKNGEEGWRGRVQRDPAVVVTREKTPGRPSARPVSLMDRMTQLDASSQTWRVRVAPSDAPTFTVAHRLAASASASCVTAASNESSPPSSSSSEFNSSPEQVRSSGGKRAPRVRIFKSKTGNHLPQNLPKLPPNVTLRPPKPDYRRTVSTPEPERTRTVECFELTDENFDQFFAPKPSTLDDNSNSQETDLEALDLTDFDSVTSSVATLGVVRRRVQRPQRNVAATNALTASRGERSYTETRLHAGERLLRQERVAELAKTSSLAVEALAGLASSERLSRVSLRPVSGVDTRELPPYTHPMLLRVKGRRHACPRLMQPCAGSVSEGDDFILVTPDKVFHYKGQFANVIERRKAGEVAAFIVACRDLGVASGVAAPVAVSSSVLGGAWHAFWQVLGGPPTAPLCPTGGDDEVAEATLDSSNRVYRVAGGRMEQHDGGWARAPTVAVLRGDEVLVFDFGSEVYSWSGKRASGLDRKAGVLLARGLWDQPYDYTGCEVNPVQPGSGVMKGPRPTWGVLGKITENLETVTFKEKFIDWPDLAQAARIKEEEEQEEVRARVEPVCVLEPIEPSALELCRPPEPDLVLEMARLGRGTVFYDEEEMRQMIVTTRSYKVWHVSDTGATLVPPASACHLYAGETYVVRWYYRITTTGRTLKGLPSKHAVTGRDRVAYFFWQGSGSSVSDKGVCALLTVELDRERGPHVRVDMNQEPPAFLNLFDGSLVIHADKRPATDSATDPRWRMFLVRGEIENEGHLVETRPSRDHLRSRSVLVLCDPSGAVHLWLGCRSAQVYRQIGRSTAAKLASAPAAVLGWPVGMTGAVVEHGEGEEGEALWRGLGEGTEGMCSYQSLDSNDDCDWQPRVWLLRAQHDCFTATEMTSPYRLEGAPNAFPLLQEELYSPDLQPALCLVSAGPSVYLWQGWWCSDDDNNNNSPDTAGTTGSALLRYNFARKAAMQTAITYAESCGKTTPQLVVAGLEPHAFTQLFPTWHHRADVAAIQRKDGRFTTSTAHPLPPLLASLQRLHYPLEDLTALPLPDGVDPSRLEDYLSPEDFATVLGVSREEFGALQPWRRRQLKRGAGLF